MKRYLMSAPVRVALIGMGRMGRALDALATERGSRWWRGWTRPTCDAVSLARCSAAPRSRSSSPNRTSRSTTLWPVSRVPVRSSSAPQDGGRDRPTCSGLSARISVPRSRHRIFRLACSCFWRSQQMRARWRDVAGFDAHILETHHTAKKDAPSGTAIALAEQAEGGFGASGADHQPQGGVSARHA